MKMLLAVSLLILCALPTQADEELITATIMFEYTGTAEQLDSLVKVFLVDMEKEVIIGFKDHDVVAYCSDYEHCVVVPGTIVIVEPKEPSLSL